MLARSPAAEKQRRYYRRKAAGRGSLRLDEIDLVAAADVLEQLGMLPVQPVGAEHDRKDIARAHCRARFPIGLTVGGGPTTKVADSSWIAIATGSAIRGTCPHC